MSSGRDVAASESADTAIRAIPITAAGRRPQNHPHGGISPSIRGMNGDFKSNMTDSDLPSDSLHGTEILGLMARFPALTRAEITAAVARCGPKREAIDRELVRVSARRRGAA